MSSFKRPTTIKAYSMLNSNRRHSMLPKIKNLNNLPTFKSHSKNYYEIILNENKNNYQNVVCCSNKSNSIAKSSRSNQNIKCVSSIKKSILDNMCFFSRTPLPSPKDANFNQVFKDKIKICMIEFNSSHVKAKKEKLRALTEINNLMSKKNEAKELTAEQKNLLFDMINYNIFEQDPFISIENIPNSNERPLEHVSLIYQILNQFFLVFPEKCKIDLFKKGIRLLNLQDTNETENLVDFLINYTKKHPEQINEIWKLLKAVLINVRYDIYTPYCVNPIISYMTPFFMPNRISNLLRILYTHILPLYIHEKLPVYFNKLNNFVIQIIENSSEDQSRVIQYLIKHFPYQCGQKQPLFSSAIISIIKIIDEHNLNSISAKLFRFIAMSIKSPNSKLAESALSLLMQQNMRQIIIPNYEVAASILYTPLKWSYALHWDNFIKEQSKNALAILMNSKFDFNNNKALYNFLSVPGIQSQQKTKKIQKEDSSKIWASIFKIAAKKYRSIEMKKYVFIVNNGIHKRNDE